ncbi:MAG: GxGYxYP domain-containing protein [Verrucomicrobiia bacterium]
MVQVKHTDWITGMIKCLALFVAAMVVAAAQGASPPRVAVLVEEGLLPAGGTPALPSFRMVEALARHGIQAQALSAAEMSNPAILNTQRVTVLVLPYGNAFPRPAFKNLRAFHAAGGCLVMNGVPFCHPCDKVDGKWKDLGHVSFFDHNARGIGTGGFGALLARDRDPRALVTANPLGLKTSMLPNDNGSYQWLDPRSLAGEDEVIPLVNIGVGTEWHPAAALIRHRCAAFRGARDVWIGQIAQDVDELNCYLAEQLLLRGVLWCQLEKGELSADAFHTQLAALDKIPKPEPLPANLPFAVTPRPWGDTYLPKSKPPARRLLAVNVQRLKPEERIALTCLQGLTSREQPRIWLRRDREDQAWLDWHKEKGYIDGYEVVTNWTGLFRQFSSAYKGAIIPDAKLYRGNLLAVNVAACENLIIATPELAEKLALPVRIDLRGWFKTYTEGMRWVWANYKNQLSRHLCKYAHPSLLEKCTFAYDLQWRSVVFWIAGPLDEGEPGADKLAECRLMAEIFAEMDPNTAMLGFPAIPPLGDGFGLGEPDGVAFASRYAKGVVGSDYLGNVCVMSGVRIERLEQPKQPTPPPLEAGRIYIALVMSDGDNENAWMDFFKKYFNHPSYGKFPLAFGMGPPIRELMPAVAQWYYEHALPQTEFIADVSGVAYTQPENYGLAYADRERVLAGFLEWTARLMHPMEMRTVRTARGGDPIVARYAKELPFCHSIFADMGHDDERNGIDKLTYSLPGGMPVFRAVTGGRYGKDGFLREVREQLGTRRPAFVHGWVNCWIYGPEDLTRIYEQRDSNMEFVTPSQLAALYRPAKERGWVK